MQFYTKLSKGGYLNNGNKNIKKLIFQNIKSIQKNIVDPVIYAYKFRQKADIYQNFPLTNKKFFL